MKIPENSIKSNANWSNIHKNLNHDNALKKKNLKKSVYSTPTSFLMIPLTTTHYDENIDPSKLTEQKTHLRYSSSTHSLKRGGKKSKYHRKVLLFELVGSCFEVQDYDSNSTATKSA